MLAYIGNSAEVQLPAVYKPNSELEITGIYTLFKSIREAGYISPPECHSAMEMVYVIDGTVGFTANENIYKLPAGHISFHPTMEFHRLWTEDNKPATILIVSFDLSGNLTGKFKSGVFELPEREKAFLESIIAYLDSQNPKYDSNLEMHYRFYYENSSQRILNAVTKMLEAFMISFADLQMKSMEPENDNMHLYARIVSILEQSVYDSISISEIAEKCNVSASTVKNTFKSYAGCTVHKFLLKIKIRKAIELLSRGMTVNEVSDTLGFCSPNYFSQVFSRETGRRASEYK